MQHLIIRLYHFCIPRRGVSGLEKGREECKDYRKEKRRQGRKMRKKGKGEMGRETLTLFK